MSGFFEPRQNENCNPWTASHFGWSAPVLRLIEDSTNEAVEQRIAELYTDPTLRVCAISAMDMFLGAEYHPGGPGVKRYYASVIVQVKIDPNGGQS